MQQATHTFSNGVSVYRHHLLATQLERYAEENVHEADEEQHFIDAVHSLPRGGVYVDVGAAIGYYIILASLLRPDLTVHAFEPLPTHREQLAANLRLNGLGDAASIVVHPEAIAAHPGTRRFEDLSFGSRLAPGGWRDWIKPSTRLLTDTTTLDLFAADKELALVQIDIQGFETEALQGARESLSRKAIGIMIVGTHGSRVHNACKDILLAHGYSITVDQPAPRNQPDGVLVARV